MALGVVLVGLALGELLARELLARELLAREPQLLARGLIGGAGLDPVALGVLGRVRLLGLLVAHVHRSFCLALGLLMREPYMAAHMPSRPHRTVALSNRGQS